MDKSTQSQKYQYQILEIPVHDDILNLKANQDSLSYWLNPFVYDERILEIKDQVIKLFWKLAKQHLTKQQYKVLKYTSQGLTQLEVAAKLKLPNNSHVSKSLMGNHIYKNGKCIAMHGGSIKKMKNIINNNPKMQVLLNKMQEIQEEKL